MEGRAARTAMKTARARKRLPQARGGMHGNTLGRLTVRCCRGGSSSAPLRSRAFEVGRAGTASQDGWRGKRESKRQRPMEWGAVRQCTVQHRTGWETAQQMATGWALPKATTARRWAQTLWVGCAAYRHHSRQGETCRSTTRMTAAAVWASEGIRESWRQGVNRYRQGGFGSVRRRLRVQSGVLG